MGNGLVANRFTLPSACSRSQVLAVVQELTYELGLFPVSPFARLETPRSV